MKKQLSKRRVWARFMLGKWVNETDMIRHDLDFRVADTPVEFSDNMVRRQTRRRDLEDKKDVH